VAANFIDAHLFKILLLVSFVLSYFGETLPETRMPIDFDAVIRFSIPLACMWLLIFIFICFRFRSKALWMLLGAPLILYWPIWLLINGVPPCVRHGNCI
jgi:hypothetical protein